MTEARRKIRLGHCEVGRYSTQDQCLLEFLRQSRPRRHVLSASRKRSPTINTHTMSISTKATWEVQKKDSQR